MTDPRDDVLAYHDGGPTFDVVRKGYDREQVAETLAGLDADLRVALADRDAAVSRSADLARQLQALHGEVESLRRRAASASAPTFENMGERISNMLQLAEDEAAEIRRSAQEQAAALQASVAAEAEALRERVAGEERALGERSAASQAEAERLVTEGRRVREQLLADGQQQQADLIAAGEAEHERLLTETEVYRTAVSRADELGAQTVAEVARMRAEVDEYVDTRLADFGNTLAHMVRSVEKARTNLRTP